MLLCKKIARAPGGRKRYKPTKLGGGGANRIDPRIELSKVMLTFVERLPEPYKPIIGIDETLEYFKT